MRAIVFCGFLFLILLSACKEETKVNEIEIKKALQEKELVFNSINKAWNFPARTLTSESQIIATSWNEWRLFINELNQKPKSSISAFKLKTKNLVQKAEVLQSTIPAKLNKPQIKIRLAALVTKLNALNMFLNIDRIPEKRVVQMVTDLNLEVNAFNDQIEEIVRRSQIKYEEGEEVMIKRIGGKIKETDSLPKFQEPEQVVPSFEEIK